MPQPDHHQLPALATWHDESVPWPIQVNHAMLQLASESGELVGNWAKHLYKPGRTMTRADMLDELGDVWYYVRIIAHLFDITTDQLTEANRLKLQDGHGWTGSDIKINRRTNHETMPEVRPE